VPTELSLYITHYGYLAIFLLLMLQGIGVPVPAPVEFVIMFSGYLIYSHLLNFVFVLVAVISGDIIGTGLVYYIFYFSGAYILSKKPKWIPFSQKRIDSLIVKVSNGGTRAIYIARFTPFIHGYISIIAGLMQIKPRRFIPILFITATLWNLFYLMVGWLLSPYWSRVEHYFGNLKFVMFLAVAILVLVIILFYFRRSRKSSEA
jgi:membrane protein DedA with SNARE-associated domain